MCATESELFKLADARLRIESVDNWHDAWADALKLVEQHGGAKKLRVDAEGWLSARQVLTVAFAGKTPVAFICFAVTPSKDACVEARHVSHGIDEKYVGRGIESQLYHATVERAQALGCATLRGFRLTSKWR